MLLTGFVNCHLGWEWIFYIYSIAGGIWGILWVLIVFKSPYKALHRLGQKERELFEEERRKKHADLFTSVQSAAPQEAVRAIPFKAILTSFPVWAVFVAGTTRSWVLLLVTNYFSQYLENVYNPNIIEVGYLSSLPFFVTTATVCLGAMIADTCLKRRVVSRTVARKLFNCVGFGVEASILCLVGFMTWYFPSKVAAVTLIGISCGASGFAASGYQANPLDLARDYASILMGISKLGGIGGMIMPKVVGALTSKGDAFGWACVFWVTAGLEMAGVVFYAIFASGKQQSWSNYRDARELEDDSARLSASYQHSVGGGRAYGAPNLGISRRTIDESYVDDEERPLLRYASNREEHEFTDSMTLY
ncbi:vesicular glutamate transporter 3 [Lingula anatina]|uniref:Vesicular glutamate transporter 3 n=1 Tax=Lingula anatina TaxID=7574 RepID=A0A1S3J1H8_LINAN|nr:vesicular glutamate transporter 3 [Lingula anatina]|eukprot:XP_013404118.1 vesicular glutamate transporter 3 [Lingula anatina]